MVVATRPKQSLNAKETAEKSKADILADASVAEVA